MNRFPYVVGTTEPLDFQLTSFDPDTQRQAPFDATELGWDIGLHLYDRDGAFVNLTARVSWLEPTTSVARVLLHVGDLLYARQPYSGRFVLTDSAARVGYIPNGHDADIWDVVQVRGR